MDKKRITLTLREDQFERLGELADDDDPRYDSKSKAARHLLDQVENLEEEVAELRREVDRLQNEKQVLVEQHQQTQELDIYREQHEEFFDASLSQRLKWLLFGK